MYYIMDDSKTSNDPLIPDKMFSLHLNPIWRIMIIIGLDYPFNSWELSFNFMPSFHCSGWLNSCLFFILHLRSLHLTCHESWECRTSAICIHDNIWHCNVTGLMNVFFTDCMIESPRGRMLFLGLDTIIHHLISHMRNTVDFTLQLKKHHLTRPNSWDAEPLQWVFLIMFGIEMCLA